MMGLADIDSIDRIVSIDVEATGYSVPEGEQLQRLIAKQSMPGVIVQLGCVELLRTRKGWKLNRSWETLVNPDSGISYRAFMVHGIRRRDLAHAPRFSEIYEEFNSFVGGAPLLAHDASNEVAFLNHEMRRAHLDDIDYVPPYAVHQFLDTQHLGRAASKRGAVSLDRLCDLLWVDRAARLKRHGAALDAELAAEVFIRLAAGEDPSRHPLLTLAETNPPPGNAMAAAWAAAMSRTGELQQG